MSRAPPIAFKIDPREEEEPALLLLLLLLLVALVDSDFVDPSAAAERR